MQAKNLYREISQEAASKTTIAIGLLDDGTTVRAVNFGATDGVAAALGAIQADVSGIAGDAERFLHNQYASRLQAIGVSNYYVCKYCIQYFSQQSFYDVFFETGRYVRGR